MTEPISVPVRSLLALAFSLGLGVHANGASSFDELRSVLEDRHVLTQTRAEAEEFNVYRAGRLPHYEVTASSFVVNGVEALANRANATLKEDVDYYPRLTKLLHPNGICFTGEWAITEPSPYSGYFAQGSRALFVGRASVAMTETEAGHKRGFGFAGKLFASEDTSKQVTTANFFTVDTLLGTHREHFSKTALTNEPETGFDLGLIWLGLKIKNILDRADVNPGFRPLYPIAELGVQDPKTARSPMWMRIRPGSSTARIDELDFRNELDIAKFHRDGIKLTIDVSDTTKDAEAARGWTRLGTIHLRESYVSYGCDRQLHFAHPRMRAKL